MMTKVINTSQPSLFSAIDNQWLLHQFQPIVIEGGPGTGKTTLLVDYAQHYFQQGNDPQSLLYLTAAPGGRPLITKLLSERIAQLSSGVTVLPEVKTPHSLAYSILQLQAKLNSNPPPQLINAREQDLIIHQILEGNEEMGRRQWPAQFQASLLTDSFASMLRDFMLRASERGLGPEQVKELGVRHERQDWIAAAQIYEEYLQIITLRAMVGMENPGESEAAVNVSDVVRQALYCLDNDNVVIDQLRSRYRMIIVDDVQHMDPLSARLLSMMGSMVPAMVVAADKTQQIFTWRGASIDFWNNLKHNAQQVISLKKSFRFGSAIAELVRRFDGPLLETDEDQHDSVHVQLYSTSAQQAESITAAFSRAYYQHGIPWNKMAVIVRSFSSDTDQLVQTFQRNAIPVQISAKATTLKDSILVAALIGGLKILAGCANEYDCLAYLQSPLFDSFPNDSYEVMISTMTEAQRIYNSETTSETIDHIVTEALTGHTDVASQIGGLMPQWVAVLSAAQQTVQKQGIAAGVWELWGRSNAAQRYQKMSYELSIASERAQRELDAVTDFFTIVQTWINEGYDTSGPKAAQHLLQYLTVHNDREHKRTQPTGTEAITITTAHQTVGEQWEMVAVYGVQDQIWPNPKERTNLLSTSEFLAAADFGDPSVVRSLSMRKLNFDEERRLFIVALTRAQHALLISAVDSSEGVDNAEPSRFFRQLTGYPTIDSAGMDSHTIGPPRRRKTGHKPLYSYHPDTVISSLRTELSAHQCPDRPAVARTLTYLARHGFSAADPASWYGIHQPSSTAPIVHSHTLRLSPSSLHELTGCPLRWFLTSRAGSSPHNAAIIGSLVHCAAQGLAGGLTAPEVWSVIEQLWDQINFETQWYSNSQRNHVQEMIFALARWMKSRHSAHVQIEVKLSQVLGSFTLEQEEIKVVLAGRVDRIEDDGQGIKIVDLKTSKTPLSQQQTLDNEQLFAYQILAYHAGATDANKTDQKNVLSGAELIYVGKISKRNHMPTQRLQPALSEDQIAAKTTEIMSLAHCATGPTFVAQSSTNCRNCPVKNSCPISSEGNKIGQPEAVLL